jgi:hypothetical protein
VVFFLGGEWLCVNVRKKINPYPNGTGLSSGEIIPVPPLTDTGEHTARNLPSFVKNAAKFGQRRENT